VNFPKWGDPVEYTVAEVRNGKTQAYPDADFNHYAAGDDPTSKLVSVQSVVVDPTGNWLWILDTGSIGMGTVKPGGAKLLAVDLDRNRVTKKILFPRDVALSTSYLNDVRFDLHRGSAGMASGKSWRRLNDHPSTKPDPEFLPVVEGEMLRIRLPGKP